MIETCGLLELDDEELFLILIHWDSWIISQSIYKSEGERGGQSHTATEIVLKLELDEKFDVTSTCICTSGL